VHLGHQSVSLSKVLSRERFFEFSELFNQRHVSQEEAQGKAVLIDQELTLGLEKEFLLLFE
jgi:hypothetical protein